MTSATLRDILAQNLRRMIERDAEKRGDRYSVRAWAQARELDVRMIDRLTKGEHAVTLDKLDDIASACGIEAWQLLVDGLDADSPPAAKVTEEDRALLSRLRKLLDQH